MKELAEWLRREREKDSEGHWTYSYRFGELRVARDCGLLPSSKWDSLSLADKEEAFAFWKSEQEMKAWETHLQEQEAKKRARKMKLKGGYK